MAEVAAHDLPLAAAPFRSRVALGARAAGLREDREPVAGIDGALRQKRPHDGPVHLLPEYLDFLLRSNFFYRPPGRPLELLFGRHALFHSLIGCPPVLATVVQNLRREAAVLTRAVLARERLAEQAALGEAALAESPDLLVPLLPRLVVVAEARLLRVQGHRDLAPVARAEDLSRATRALHGRSATLIPTTAAAGTTLLLLLLLLRSVFPLHGLRQLLEWLPQVPRRMLGPEGKDGRRAEGQDGGAEKRFRERHVARSEGRRERG